MAAARFPGPPLPWRWIPVFASPLVPRPERPAWLESRQRELSAWWTLVERGEIASGAELDAAALSRRTLAGAMAIRFPPARLREWAGSASFIVFLATVVLAASAALTGGFAGARWFCKAACSAARSTRAEDAVAGVGFLVGFSVLTGFALILHARPAIARRGSKYWGFLALKTACAVTLLPLLWFEALYALRTRLPLDGLPALLSALGIAGALLAALGAGVWWCFDDQSRRCPVCLARLALPVRFGRWSSVLDPVSTELVCPRGHGALTLPESECAAPGHWTGMDESWRGLFQAAH
jgi:hypothetical protein